MSQKAEVKSEQLTELLTALDEFRQNWTDLMHELKQKEEFDFEHWQQKSYENRKIVIRMQDILWDSKRKMMGLEEFNA